MDLEEGEEKSSRRRKRGFRGLFLGEKWMQT